MISSSSRALICKMLIMPVSEECWKGRKICENMPSPVPGAERVLTKYSLLDHEMLAPKTQHGLGTGTQEHPWLDAWNQSLWGIISRDPRRAEFWVLKGSTVNRWKQARRGPQQRWGEEREMSRSLREWLVERQKGSPKTTSIYNTIVRTPFVDPLGNPFEISKEAGNRALVRQSGVLLYLLKVPTRLCGLR